jgi:hypothetical protein
MSNEQVPLLSGTSIMGASETQQLLGSVNGSDSTSGDGGGGGHGDGKNKLGTINGVLVPCSLNIIGVILFEKLGWGIGEAGWLGVL